MSLPIVMPVMHTKSKPATVKARIAIGRILTTPNMGQSDMASMRTVKIL